MSTNSIINTFSSYQEVFYGLKIHSTWVLSQRGAFYENIHSTDSSITINISYTCHHLQKITLAPQCKYLVKYVQNDEHYLYFTMK